MKKEVLPVSEVEVSISSLRSKYVGKHFVDEESGLLYEVIGFRMLKDRTTVANVKIVR